MAAKLLGASVVSPCRCKGGMMMSTKEELETIVPKRPDWSWWLRLFVLLLFGVFYLPILVFAVILSCGGGCR